MLLIEYAKRICLHISGTKGNDNSIDASIEPLNQLIPLVPPGIPCVETGRVESKGTQVISINGADIELGESVTFTNEELVSQFYDIYEQNAEFLRAKYEA